MSQETMSRLVEAVEKDEVLREKLLSAESAEQQLKIAAEHGHQVTMEDLQASASPSNEGEIFDTDLEGVSGGTRLYCAKGQHFKQAKLTVR